MEYSKVSAREYESCKKIAHQILSLASKDNHKDIRDLRAIHIINTLNREFSPNIIGFYSLPSHVNCKRNMDYLAYFNQQFDYNGIYLHAKELIQVDDVFTETVSGLTTFDRNNSTIFLNATNNFQRLVFTCLHEFTHMWQARYSQDYIEALALINEDKIQGNAYPPELQPIEDEANVVASLLLLPDKSLKSDIKKLSFNQLQAKYNTSGTALFNRLYNYFYYSDEFDEYESSQAAQAWVANDHRVMYHVRKRLD